MKQKDNILAGILLVKSYQDALEKLRLVQTRLDELEALKKDHLSNMEALLKTLDLLKARPADLFVPPEIKYKAESIGDVMEQAIHKLGPMPKAELIAELHKAGKIGGKNTRVILANAIKRDAKKRFIVREGKVTLTDEWGKLLLAGVDLAKTLNKPSTRKQKK
jgi:hypothetical protein